MSCIQPKKNSLKFKLLAFWRKMTPFIDQKCTYEKVTKNLCMALPPSPIWTKSKRTATFFRETVPYCKKRLGNIFSNLFVSTCAIEACGVKHCRCYIIHTCSLNIVHSTFSKSVQNKIPLQLIHILSKHVFMFSLRPSLISPKVVLSLILIGCLSSSVSS